MTHTIGYVVKRFPRASETFIAQEILELERQGAEVQILTLWHNDIAAEHRWLHEIKAPITHCGATPLSDAWKWLHRRSLARPQRAHWCEQALAEAFAYPDRRGRHRLREAVAVADAALEAGVEHLHAHFANDPAFVAYLAHLASGLPFSFTAHAKDVYAKALPAPTLRRVVEHSAFAVTVSDDNQRHLTKMLGPRAAANVRRLYNGVDLSSIAPGGSSGRRFAIACVARLIEKKGVDSLLRALVALERQGLDFRATIIGDGPQRPALEQLVAAAQLGARVSFTGMLPHEKVIAAVTAHDVFVLPARIADDGDRDALPTVLLEAMAAGLPCVSTPVGGIPEIIAHQQTGLILPSDRPLALAEALAELASQPELRAKMGRAGRARASELFDRQQNVAQLHRWFEQSCRGEAVSRRRQALRIVEA